MLPRMRGTWRNGPIAGLKRSCGKAGGHLLKGAERLAQMAGTGMPGRRPGRRMTPILVIGSSHVNAVGRALSEAPDAAFALLQMRASDLPKSAADARRVYAGYRPDMVALMIGGNHHHAAGLLEGPEPFDFECARVPGVDTSRRIVSRREIRAALLATTEKARLRILTAREYFPDATMTYVCSPPPVADSGHILRTLHNMRQSEGTIVARAGEDPKVSPAAIRLKIFYIQIDVFAEFCQGHGIDFIPPPQAALDGSGFLAEPFRKGDPLHGNKLYGELVVRSLRDYQARIAARRGGGWAQPAAAAAAAQTR